MSPADRTACAELLRRLTQVTQTISASSELLTNSLDRQQLSQRIADETTRLRQAADLMAQGSVPPRLVAADRDLVAALHAFADDFNRAAGAAKQGDLSTAAGAMNDEATVRRIVEASQTIEETCA
ncbi:hypothetical protein [Rugosimonospora africana]|nr:hypothetical protein [Rugosimonospora africana]